MSESLPILKTVKSVAHSSGDDEIFQQYINNFWKPTLSVTGLEGLPSIERAGNVVYKELKCKVSIRLPPTMKGEVASKIIKEKLLEKKDDTFNAFIDLSNFNFGNGLDAPKLPESI